MQNMDEENIQRLTDVLSRLTGSMENTKVEFDEYGNQLSARAARERQIENARIAAIERRIAEEEAAFNRAAERWEKYSKAVVSTVGSMTTQAGAFKALTNIVGLVVKTLGSLLKNVPVLGAALKGLADGAADAIQLIADTTYKAFETFGKISGSGVVSNFESMINASKKTGLLFEELEGVIAQNSEALAAFGNTALDGSTRLQSILAINLKSNERFAEQFQKIGISFSEFAEYQASYVSQQTRLGFLKGKDDAYIAEQARKYAEELDTLSKLTGKNRKDLQKEQEKLLSDARFRAKMVELEAQGAEGKKRADEIRFALSAVPENMKEGFKNMVVNGGAIIDKASQQFAQMMQLGGVDATKLTSGLANGTITAANSYQEIINASKVYVQKVHKLGTLVGADSDVTALLVEAADLAKRTGNIVEDVKKVEEERKKVMEALDPMAQAATKTHELANEMQLMLVSTKAVPAAVNFMADRVKDFGKFLENYVFNTTGKPTKDQEKDLKLIREFENFEQAKKQREEAKAKYEEAKATRERLEKQQNGFNSPETMAARVDERRKLRDFNLSSQLERNAAKKFGVQAPTAAPTGQGKTKGINDLLSFTGNSGSEQNFNKLDPSIRDKVIAAAEEYNAATDRKLTINSAFRDSADQKRLYAETVAAQRPGIGPTGMPVSKPGTSIHERGLAVDIQEYNDRAAISALRQQGLMQTVRNDPVHFTIPRAANGALIQPNLGGTLVQVAEAGKPEAIVPLPNGRSIPVTITNQQDDVVVKNLELLSSRFDLIIDLLSKNNNIKGNLIQALA